MSHLFFLKNFVWILFLVEGLAKTRKIHDTEIDTEPLEYDFLNSAHAPVNEERNIGEEHLEICESNYRARKNLLRLRNRLVGVIRCTPEIINTGEMDIIWFLFYTAGNNVTIETSLIRCDCHLENPMNGTKDEYPTFYVTEVFPNLTNANNRDFKHHRKFFHLDFRLEKDDVRSYRLTECWFIDDSE